MPIKIVDIVALNGPFLTLLASFPILKKEKKLQCVMYGSRAFMSRSDFKIPAVARKTHHPMSHLDIA